MTTNPTRSFPIFDKTQRNTPSQEKQEKKRKLIEIDYENPTAGSSRMLDTECIAMDLQQDEVKKKPCLNKSRAPLAEKMRPNGLDDYIGQTHLIGPDTLLYNLLKNGKIPSMILWGPPGCGKTSLVNVIMKEIKKNFEQPVKFVKMSATSASTKDVKNLVSEAKALAKQGQRTVIFMDEIHRFNKLQQDIFLPHVENGTFILIGATTENPSSSLNSALLSRCRVFILKKLNKEDLTSILSKAVSSLDGQIMCKNDEEKEINSSTKFFIEQEIIDWLSEVCDGDARVALGALEVTIQVKTSSADANTRPIRVHLNDIKDSLQQTQTLSDSKSHNVQHMYNALHHCIIGDEDSAALYWLARIMHTGEDPVCIARRLVAIASEDISIADENALSTAIHTVHACQMIGMPECDVILAQCVVYLARAEKSREIANAVRKAQDTVDNHKGPQPDVPLFIKDTSGQRKLRATLGANYKNMVRQENTNKVHLPEGLENMDFFDDQDS